MLPDFPETKKLYTRFFQTHMRRKARELSPLMASVRTRHLHEGRDMSIVREDQSTSNTKTQQFTSTGEVTIEDIRNMTFEKALKHHDGMVVDMVKQQMGYFTERVGRRSEGIAVEVLSSLCLARGSAQVDALHWNHTLPRGAL